jgi:hypothetical protein
MKKAIASGAALLVTTLGGATAANAATALPAGGLGCGITVHVHNTTKSTIKVQWSKSDSRAHTIAGPGFWKKLGSGTTTIQSSKTGSKAFTLDFSCSTEHQYRVHYTKGNSSGYVYYPKNGWTTSRSFTVKVK